MASSSANRSTIRGGIVALRTSVSTINAGITLANDSTTSSSNLVLRSVAREFPLSASSTRRARRSARSPPTCRRRRACHRHARRQRPRPGLDGDVEGGTLPQLRADLGDRAGRDAHPGGERRLASHDAHHIAHARTGRHGRRGQPDPHAERPGSPAGHDDGVAGPAQERGMATTNGIGKRRRPSVSQYGLPGAFFVGIRRRGRVSLSGSRTGEFPHRP